MEKDAKQLVVRLRNWVGDVVLSVPSLLALEQAGYTLHLVGKRWAKDLFAGHRWAVYTKPSQLRQSVTQLAQLKNELCAKDSGFDGRINALVYPTSFSSALEMRLAGLNAMGYRQEARGFLLKASMPIVYGGHALRSYWDLTQRFLGTSQAPPEAIGLQISPQDQSAADELLKRSGINGGFLCIVPFAGGTFEKIDKRWPYFKELLAQLVASNHQVVICPGPGEIDEANTQYGTATILPNVSLGVYLGVLKRANAVISNDTGPGHMAAAVGTKVISVLGPTKPEQWAPWGRAVQVVRDYPNWPDIQRVYAAVSTPPSPNLWTR